MKAPGRWFLKQEISLGGFVLLYWEKWKVAVLSQTEGGVAPPSVRERSVTSLNV